MPEKKRGRPPGKRPERRVARRGRPKAKMAFPVIEEWMNGRGVTYQRMAEWCGVSDRKLRYAMRTGRAGVEVVNAVLRVTGLTYEEAFWKEEGS